MGELGFADFLEFSVVSVAMWCSSLPSCRGWVVKWGGHDSFFSLPPAGGSGDCSQGVDFAWDTICFCSFSWLTRPQAPQSKDLFLCLLWEGTAPELFAEFGTVQPMGAGGS